MTPEEEDYQKAIRRIQEAEKTGAVELNLSGLLLLNRLPPELERLKSSKPLTSTGATNSAATSPR